MEEQRLIGLDLSRTSLDVIEILLEDASDDNIFEEIFLSNKQRPEVLRILFEHPSTPENIKAEIRDILNLPLVIPSASPPHKEIPQEVKKESLLVKIQRLPVPQRRLLAMRGGREIRSILIKDTNKDVVLSVLENPKITESEIEMIARMRSIPDEVIRIIANNREWLKNYNIILALVLNPKTPPGISANLVGNLKTRDLELLEKNKNVSEASRAMAKRILQVRKPR